MPWTVTGWSRRSSVFCARSKKRLVSLCSFLHFTTPHSLSPSLCLSLSLSLSPSMRLFALRSGVSVVPLLPVIVSLVRGGSWTDPAEDLYWFYIDPIEQSTDLFIYFGRWVREYRVNLLKVFLVGVLCKIDYIYLVKKTDCDYCNATTLSKM